MLTRPLVLGTMVSVLAAACAESDTRGPVEWRLRPDPAVTVGVVDGAPEYQLNQVTGLVPLSDGSLAIANTGSSEVRVYSVDGRLRWSLGGEGDGPGEFRGEITLARLPGDSLVAFDWLQRRITVVSPEGRVARILPVPDTLPNLQLEGAFDDGTLVISSRHLHVGPGLNRDSVTYHRVASDGRWLNWLTWARGQPVFMLAEGAPTIDDQPLTVQTSVAVGSWLALLPGTGTAVRLVDPNGRPVGNAAWSAEPRPVTDELIERWRQWHLSRVRYPEGWRRWHREVEVPELLPISDRLVQDDEGRLWVRPWVEPWRDVASDSVAWWVVDREGGLVATVAVPTRLDIRAVVGERVFAVRRNALDVEFVEVWPFDR